MATFIKGDPAAPEPDDGTTVVYDRAKNAYVPGPTPGGGGGGGGVTVHGELTGRSAPDQHPIGAVTGLQDALDGKAATGHDHDDRYYTEPEVDTALAGKADTSHQHPVTDLTATGARDATTALHGDGAWRVPGGGPQDINAQTSTAYTLAEDDAGAVVTVANASPVTLTVPASVFTTGHRVDVLQSGAGSVTLAAGAGMTLHGTPSLVTRAQWSAATILFLSDTEGVVIGDLATP